MASSPEQPGISRYQKGKNSLDLNEAKDDGRGISWTIYKQSAPRCRQITTATPYYSVFYRQDASLPAAQQQCQSTEGSSVITRNNLIKPGG